MIPKRTIQFILVFILLTLVSCSPAVYTPEDYPQIDRRPLCRWISKNAARPQIARRPFSIPLITKPPSQCPAA